MIIIDDWAVNAHSLRIRLLLLGYRTTNALYTSGRLAMLSAIPLLILYRIYQGLIGCELPWSVRAGPRLRIFHGFGLVVNPRTRIGADCTLRQCTTLGARLCSSDAPTLGDRVDVGWNSVVLGEIHIGDDVRIGAGAVVVRSVPQGASVRGASAEFFLE